MDGKKHDQGKPMWNLFDLRQAEKIVKVLTFGAKKYDKYNWQKVTPFKERYYDALMRHLTAWKNGEKIDKESGMEHLAHVGANLNFLMWGEDNLFNLGDLRIGLDIDGVLADFTKAAYNRLGLNPSPKFWRYDYQFENGDFWKDLGDDKDFWLNIEPLIDPDDLPFEPTCYITARHQKELTKEWLVKNGFPTKPVIICKDGDKLNAIKEMELDVFVDDKPSNYYKLRNNGFRMLLMNQTWNERHYVGNDRIFSLKDLERI